MSGDIKSGADHFDGKRFFTPGAPPLPRFSDLLRWQFSRSSAPWPNTVVVSEHPLQPIPADSPQITATWINHSTFLLRSAKLAILIDPIFSNVAGPFGLIGPRRVHPPGISFESLPQIDWVLLSHDHYDHCDLPTLQRLARAHSSKAICPLGNGDLLRRAGFKIIVELDWWEKTQINAEVSVTVTPSQHWSRRLSGHRCGRLWGGFFIQFPHRSTYFVGDTGYHPSFFREIAERLGAPDLAMIPIGAYEPRWFMRGQHCNPAEAAQIHLDVQAKKSLAMHWGTFQLTDEAREDPPRELQSAMRTSGISADRFVVLEPGETVTV